MALGQFGNYAEEFINQSKEPLKLGDVNIVSNSQSLPSQQDVESYKKRIGELTDKPWTNDLKEVGKAAVGGAVVDLPEMVGKAAQALSPEDNAVSNWGKGIVKNAEARSEEWKNDMTGRGALASAMIGGARMLAPSLATLPTYLAGPAVGSLATLALYGGSQYTDVRDRALRNGLSKEDAHLLALESAAIEGGGELISNKLSLGLLGAGSKAAKTLPGVIKGATDTSTLKNFGRAYANELVGENLTEGLQQYGETNLEANKGIGKSQSLAESFGETVGPTTALTAFLAPFGLAGHYGNSKRAEAINSVLDDPKSSTPIERQRVVDMLAHTAEQNGVDKGEVDSWRADAHLAIKNNESINRYTEEPVSLKNPIGNKEEKDWKGKFDTGETIATPEVAKAYHKYQSLFSQSEDPNDESYNSGKEAVISKLKEIVNPGEGKAVDPIKADEAKKALDLIDNAHSSKQRQWDKLTKAAESYNEETGQIETPKGETTAHEAPTEQPVPEKADSSNVPTEQLIPEATPEVTNETPISTEEPSVQHIPVPEDRGEVPTVPMGTIGDTNSEVNQEIPQEQPITPIETVENTNVEAPSLPSQAETGTSVLPNTQEVNVEPVVQESKSLVDYHLKPENLSTTLNIVDSAPSLTKLAKTLNVTPEEAKYIRSEVNKAYDEGKIKTKQSSFDKKSFKDQVNTIKNTFKEEDLNYVLNSTLGPQFSSISTHPAETLLNYGYTPDKIKEVLNAKQNQETSQTNGSSSTQSILQEEAGNAIGSSEGVQSGRPENRNPEETEIDSLNREKDYHQRIVDGVKNEGLESVYHNADPSDQREPHQILKESRRRLQEIDDSLKELGEKVQEVAFANKKVVDNGLSELDSDILSEPDSLDFDDETGSYNFDLDPDAFRDESLTSLLRDKTKGTLKVLDSIGFSQKAKNKYIYVKAKLKEVNASNEEQNVINTALEALGQDGKWEWQDLVDLVTLQLSKVKLDVIEDKQEFAYHGVDKIFPDDGNTIAYKSEMHVESSTGDDLMFPNVSKLRNHFLTDKAVAHIRTARRNGIYYILEVQSDVKQESREDREDRLIVAERDRIVKKVPFKERLKIRNEIYDLLAGAQGTIFSEARNRANENNIDYSQVLVDTVINYLNKVKSLDPHITSTESLKEREDFILNDLIPEFLRDSKEIEIRGYSDVFDTTDKDLKNALVGYIRIVDHSYNVGYEGAVLTQESLNDREYTRLEPYIEKRAIRETIKFLTDVGVPNSPLRLATPKTLIKIEAWNEVEHRYLIKKYAELSKAISKELNMKEVTDDYGNTWYETTLNGYYIPLSYDLNPSEIAESNQKENKSTFDKFLNKISDSVKSKVDFHFIPDFKTYDKWEKLHGFSTRASGQMPYGRGLFHIDRNGKPHIFMNGSISPNDFKETFVHELVGHFGARGILELFSTKDPDSTLSKYDNYLVNLINSTPYLRQKVMDRYENWRMYHSNYLKDKMKPGESYDDYFNRLEKGKDYLEYKVTLRGKPGTVRIPSEVAIKFADEHIAELAKELVFDEKFIEREVGYGAKDSEVRTRKRSELNKWLSSVLKRIKHYLRSIFGDYTNSISEQDLKKLIAKSVDTMFTVVDKDLFTLAPKGTIVNTDGYSVPLEQRNTTLSIDDAIRMDVFGEQLDPEDITSNFKIDTKFENAVEVVEELNRGVADTSKTINEEMYTKLDKFLREHPLLSSLRVFKNMPYQEAYKAIQNVYKGKIGKIEDSVSAMSKLLEGLSPTANAALFEYFTTANADVNKLSLTLPQKNIAKKAKDAIRELGQVSVDLGLINKETYELNKDAYLHTMYLKYLSQYRGSGKSTSMLSWMKEKKKLNAEEKAALGQIKDVRFLVAETIGVIGRDHVLINMFNTLHEVSDQHKLYWTLSQDKTVKMPWDNRKTKSIDQAYQILDDISFIIEKSKDENQLTFDGQTTTIAKLKENAEEIKRRIDAIEHQAWDEAFSHFKEMGWTTTSDRSEFLRNHYKQIPNKPKFGKLRGQYVRKEIYDDLDIYTSSYDLSNKNEIEKLFARGGLLERLNRFWKQSMVAFNPGSWVRNVFGNFSLLDLSTSTSSVKLAGMLHEELMNEFKGNPSKYWKLARDYGLFGTTFSAIELNDIYSKAQDELESARISWEARTKSSFDNSLPFLDDRLASIANVGKVLKEYGKEGYHRTSATTAKWYALLEGSFKTVAFRDYIQQWESQNADKYPGGLDSLNDNERVALLAKAADHANTAIIDYSQAHSWIKTLNRIPFGAPFLTYTYKAGPIAVRAMMNHPIKFAKYAALPAMLTMLSAAINDWDDKDIEKFKSRLPEYYRNNPGVAFIPFKDSTGRPQILPLDYLIPWSQWATAARKVANNFYEDQGVSPIGTAVKSVGTLVHEFGFLGGPTPSAMSALLSGRDDFTGNQIMTPGASADQQLFDLMKFSWNMAAPAWLSSHGWFSKMYDAFGTPATNQFGELKYTPLQAVSDITGFRPISVNMKGGLDARQKEFQSELRDLSTFRNRIAQDRSLSSQEKATKIRDIVLREKLLRNRMREELNP